MHVLVCDDDSATRLVVTRIVAHRFGCQVSECADGAAALQFISQQAVDLLLLDLQMPVMSGIEVVETLRKDARTRSLPIVILSHVQDEPAIRYLVSLGVAGYILKPPRPGSLIPKIERFLGTTPALGIGL